MELSIRRFLGFTLVLLAAVCVSAQTSAPKKRGSKATSHKTAEGHLMSPRDLQWKEVKEVKGAQQAVVWGDPQKGAYAAFDRWPGGTDVGTHTHSNDVKAAVISGTLVMTLEGGPEKELSAPSWIHTAANEVHSTKCKAGADCVFYVTQPGKFDFKPKTPSEKK